MVLYHRTTKRKASAILARGFQDATGSYLTRGLHTGVWLSDVPLGASDGAFGAVMLAVTFGDDAPSLDEFEWIEEGKGHREWLVPAAFINAHAKVTKLEDRSDWPEYENEG